MINRILYYTDGQIRQCREDPQLRARYLFVIHLCVHVLIAVSIGIMVLMISNLVVGMDARMSHVMAIFALFIYFGVQFSSVMNKVLAPVKRVLPLSGRDMSKEVREKKVA